MPGETLPIRRNVALLSAAVAANASMLQLISAVASILRDAAARRRCPRFTNDYLRRTPCTHTSP